MIINNFEKVLILMLGGKIVYTNFLTLRQAETILRYGGKVEMARVSGYLMAKISYEK